MHLLERTDLFRRLKANPLDQREHPHGPQAVVQEPVHVFPLRFPPLSERPEPSTCDVEPVRHDVAVMP